MRQRISEFQSFCNPVLHDWNCPAKVQGRLLRTVVAMAALAIYVSSGNAFAAIGFVQGSYATPQSPQSTVSVTYTSAQTAGNLNVVVVGWNDTTAAVSSVTDSIGICIRWRLGQHSIQVN